MDNKEHLALEKYEGIQYEDEIQLIDLLTVIWKWKLLILTGTIVFAFGAGIISFNMTKVYNIFMVLRPGIVKITEEGENPERKIYIDTINNIKGILDAETFNNRILKKINASKTDDYFLTAIKLKTAIIKGSDTLKVSCLTSNINTGLQILRETAKNLSSEYESTIEYYRKNFENDIIASYSLVSKLVSAISNVKNKISTTEAEYNNKIHINYSQIKKKANDISNIKRKMTTIKTKNLALLKQLDNETNNVKAEKSGKKLQIENLIKRINDIQSEIGRVAQNSDLLIKERNSFLSSKKSADIALAAMVYSNTIQQNLSYLNTLRNQVNNLTSQTYKQTAALEMLESKIKNIEIKKDNLTQQNRYEVENLHTQIRNLENDIKDLDSQKEKFQKQRKSEVDDFKAKLVSFENEKKYIQEKIEILKYKKSAVKGIEMIQPPASEPNPVKPKITLNIALASVTGLFVMLFSAFFLEYIAKYRNADKKNI
jgi:capsular polysaccharide biosynthesis protein